ncbi:MAG: sigma-70 family RNA polymerase sigma factor [Candidatus Binataceae bacterium]
MDSRLEFKLPPPFEEAVRSHESAIMRFLLRMTANRDDALDLFQETWLRAYRAYPQLKSADGMRPWLFRIATNLCRNRARDNFRRSRAISRAMSDPTVTAAAPGSHAHGIADGVIHMRRLIAGLPDKQRLALTMRKFGGLDYREIGAALECSAASARANVCQALRRLRAAW